MNKNVKGIIIIVVLLVIIYLVYRFAFKSNFKKGYAKNKGEWVGCNVESYDKEFYKGMNTAGVDIYFKKKEVRLRPGKEASLGQCADAVTSMNVYTMK